RGTFPGVPACVPGRSHRSGDNQASLTRNPHRRTPAGVSESEWPMNTITKKILVDRIATKHKMQRTAVKNVLQDFLDEIVNELGEGNRIEFRDFGVFEVKHRAARTAQNPKTLERVPVPAKRSVRFKPGRRMREEMDAPAP